MKNKLGINRNKASSTAGFTKAPYKTENKMSEILNRIDSTYERFQRLNLKNGNDSSFNKNDDGMGLIAEDKKELGLEITKMKDDLVAAVNAKSEFLSVISHEIRTPMNAVIGMSGLLMDTNLTIEQKEYVETIRSSGDKLLTLINDILDFTEIDSGKLSLEYQPFSLRNCIGDAMDLISSSALSKHLEVIYYVDPQVPENIFGDITRLRQILVNLLNNAIKFTNQGDIFLSVVKIDKPGEDIELEFSIRDTGIGINNTDAEKIFKEFSQVDSSLTRKYGGAGLGLAICKKLVDMMGGNIWFESKEGLGTTFYFTINVKRSNVVDEKDYLLSDIPNLKGKNILIIDENRVLRQIVSLQTQMWGMKPKTTPSGYEAIDWLKKYKFDAVLLDLVLNEKYNGEIIKEIRKIKGDNFPIVALKGKSDEKADNFKVQELFTADITKPINQEELFDLFSMICAENKTSLIKSEVAEKKLSEKLPLKILIAEDNIINQKIASRILSQMGYTADVAGDGIEVLECLARQHYDLVLMDVQMPELDGLQTTGRILEKWIPAERPKIIAMTANATQGDMENCMNSGMDDFISKPILSEELRTMLEKWGSNPITKVTGALTYNNEDLIDSNTVNNLKQITGIDNKSFLTEVINLYSKQTPQIISDIKKHWKNNDMQKLILSLHNLKGSSINMGAKMIQELSKNIETRCRKGDMGEIGNDIERLEYIYQRTINEYKKLV